jgi:hypothetical protein
MRTTVAHRKKTVDESAAAKGAEGKNANLSVGKLRKDVIPFPLVLAAGNVQALQGPIVARLLAD